MKNIAYTLKSTGATLTTKDAWDHWYIWAIRAGFNSIEAGDIWAAAQYEDGGAARDDIESSGLLVLYDEVEN